MASSSDDALGQALLSPSSQPPSGVPIHDEESPMSVVVGNIEESPTRSFMETSFFGHLRALQTPTFQRLSDEETPENLHPIVRSWNNGIYRFHRYILLLVFCLLWPFGMVSFVDFQKYTDSTFHPIPGSLSSEAQHAFDSIYTNDWNDPMNPALIVLLESASNQSLIHRNSTAYAQARNFTLQLNDTLTKTCWKVHPKQCLTEPWLKLTSYYSLADENLHWLAKQTLSTPDGTTVLVQIQYILPTTGDHRALMASLLQTLQDFRKTHTSDYFTVRFTGMKFFQNDLMTSTQKDLRQMDLLVLPLALLLIGIVLPKANPAVVWIIPLVTMISTVCSWSIVMRFVAQVMQITHFTPTIMMSLSLGMGVDYTMFLLARYLEASAQDNRPIAMANMLTHAGHVVLLSGLTLMCTFLGLVCLPLQMLKSVGVGAAVAIGCALFMNWTLVPALLYTRIGTWIVQTKNAPISDQQHDDCENDDTPAQAMSTLTNLSERGRILHSIQPPASPSVWNRMSKHLLHPYKSIIALLLTFQLLLPVVQYATKVQSSISFDLLLPSTSPSLEAFHSLGDKVGRGRLDPYRILFDGHDANVTMTSAKGFDIMHTVLDQLAAIDHKEVEANGLTHIGASKEEEELLFREMSAEMKNTREKFKLASREVKCVDDMLQVTHPKATTYSGIAVLKNTRIPHSAFVSAKYCSQLKPHCPVELMHVIDQIDKIATSKDMYATFVSATLGVSPFSDDGIEWLTAARETIDRLERGGALDGVNIYIEGTAAIAYDAVNAVYSAFPTMIVITTLVVFVLMGLFFKSIFPPLRSIVSISMTLAFSFGLCVLVYQDGLFDWTHVRALTSIGDEVCWLVPIMAFSIIVGLALDYDVFLISRILEYRLEGYEHKTSIAAGLHATGGIITAAGMIMAFAFGSLMLSSNPVLYQWSFLITTAVLLDTFVIRTIVVPILTGLAGKNCWWPRQMPREQICFPEFREPSWDDMSGLIRTLEESSEYEPILTSPRSP